MAYYFSRLSFRSSITVSSSAYETLKSIGFNIISSDETRTEIIDLYEGKYQGLINLVRDAELQNINQNKSIIYNNFKANREFTAIPLDYAALQKDQKFISWLYRKQRWKGSLIIFNRHLLQSTNDLIEKVNNDLK